MKTRKLIVDDFVQMPNNCVLCRCLTFYMLLKCMQLINKHKGQKTFES